jgi:hypothetical protein
MRLMRRILGQITARLPFFIGAVVALTLAGAFAAHPSRSALPGAGSAPAPAPAATQFRQSSGPQLDPVLNIRIDGLLVPQTFLADIEAFGWQDSQRHTLSMKIAKVERMDPVQAGTGAMLVPRPSSPATSVAERLVGLRVLAIVDSAASHRVPASGHAQVRLVVIPQRDTAQVTIEEVMSGPPAVHTASGAAAVTGLSSYAAPAGAQVTILGRGFGAQRGDRWVTVCGTRAEALTWSDTAVSFAVPTSVTRSGYVGVVVDGVTSNGMFFTPYAPPSLESMSPREGAAGTQVSLDGHSFGAGQGDGWVSFGGVAAQIVSWSDTHIEALVPRGAGNSFVGVVSHNLSSNGLVFAPFGRPVVTGLSSQHLLPGSQLVIDGRNFGASAGDVVIGGIAARTATWSNTRITLTIPTGQRSGYVGVRKAGGLVSNGVFLSTAPTLARLSTWWCRPDSEVVVDGAGFSPAQGDYAVTVSGKPASVVSWSDTSIRFKVPADAQSGYVGVGSASAWSNGLYLVVVEPAHVSEIDTSTVRVGDHLRLTGTGFGPEGPSAKVVVAGKSTCPITSWSDTSVEVVIPEGLPSGYIGVMKQGVASNGIWLNVH